MKPKLSWLDSIRLRQRRGSPPVVSHAALQPPSTGGPGSGTRTDALLRLYGCLRHPSECNRANGSVTYDRGAMLAALIVLREVLEADGLTFRESTPAEPGRLDYLFDAPAVGART